MNRVPNNAGQVLLRSAFENASLLRIEFTAAPITEAGQATTGDKWIWLGYCNQFEPMVRAGELQDVRVGFSLNENVSFTAGS
jgi:hypothetical protein